jgi:predicted nucleic acid-binding protein
MTVTHYDEALTLARRLPLNERLRLVSVLVDEAANEMPATSQPQTMTPAAACAALAEVRSAFSALEGPRPSLGAQPDADRADRERALLGPAMKRAVEAWKALPHVQLVSLDNVLLDAAAELAVDRVLKGADAVYVAVAQQHRCRLVSLDREQRERTAAVVPTLTPQDALEFLTSGA